MKKRIAFFDFDGTITTKDTLLEIIKYQKGKARYYFGLLLCSPALLAYKLKWVSGHWTKRVVLGFFFKNTSYLDFQAKCDQFANSVLPEMIRPKALHEFRQLADMGAETVIVTASSPAWIRKWSDPMRISVIGTNLAVHEGKMTGAIDGRNCNGLEKVNRIKSAYDLSLYDEIYVYGDTSRDKPMMSISTIRFMKPFR
ncbi:MAG: HAD-IB family phosphatase [Chitinophagales bacterium]